MAGGSKAALVGAGFLVGLIAAIGIVDTVSGDDDSTEPVGRITEMEQTGEMHRILELHRQMLQRMEVDASPAMLRLMEDDPMWQMMRSPEWAQMDQQHEEDINRMLGRQ